MRYILLHGHIFKNAGTTFDWSLKKCFGRGFLDHREDKLMRLEGRAHLEQLVENETLCAISSHHMTRDVPPISDLEFIHVNLLRHPLIRIRSVYHFERKQKGATPGAIAAKEKSFRDYVAWRMEPNVARTIRNYQTLYLAGCHKPLQDKDLFPGVFLEAMTNIGSLAHIGLVGRYDESMVVLEEGLRSFFPDIDLSYVAQNVSGKKNVSTDESHAVAVILAELGDLAKRVIDENSIDLAIYQAAALQLQTKIENIEGFAQKLQAFRARLEVKSTRLFSR